MRHGIKRLICCGTAAAAVLTVFAGCSSKELEHDSGRKEERTTESETYEETDADVTIPDVSGTTQPSAAKLPPEGTAGDISYKIETASSEGHSDDRGYYLFSSDDDEYPYAVIIAAGEFSTGGYGIDITDIQYDGSEMTITVTETSPGPMDIVTQAFTYPCCGVKLSAVPENMKVVSTGGYEFECLYVYLDKTEIEPDWIAVFEDGAGEIMQKTYVYETPDGKYSYRNVESHTKSWGSTEWVEVVKGSGKADSKEEILDAAKDFGSAGFVLFPDDMSKAHEISEFLED